MSQRANDEANDQANEKTECCAPECCSPAAGPVSLTRAPARLAPVEPATAREVVRAAYAKVATGSDRCCGSAGDVDLTALRIGYSQDDLTAAPEGANLGLGCGNPTAIAELRPGEVVVDLGSGAGFDAFLCARKVGATGRVIGIDMTVEMIEKARANAATIGAKNVEFRLGFIEEPPVADETADVIISNCVVNLSPDKPRVLREAFRVLKRGGRLRISDIATRTPLPADVRADAAAYVSCLAGAISLDDYRAFLTAAGFVGIELRTSASRTIDDLLASDDPLVREAATRPSLRACADAFVSVNVTAFKG